MAADPPPPRTRSARLTLISLLLIPLLSLAALWAFIASVTLGSVIRDQHYNTVEAALIPGVTALEQALPLERAITLVWLGGDRRSALVQAELAGARRNTDRYIPQVRSSIIAVKGLLGAAAYTRMNIFLADLSGLGRIRAAVDSGADDTVTAFNAYDTISSAEYQFFSISSPPADPELSLMTQSAIAEARGQEATGGAISLIEGALARRGLMTQSERVLFAQQVGQQNLEVGNMFALANPAMAAVFARTYNSPAYRSLQATEIQVEASPPGRPIPVNPVTFQPTAQAFQTEAMSGGNQIGGALAARSAHLHDSTLTELALAAGLGLVAVAASVFVMMRFGRRLRVELTDLYQSARQMANERLPRLVERLHRGEDVDVEEESPPLKAGKVTETANVAQAFSTVQRTAVEAAVGQASLRKGINKVFVSLSLRNQSLLHRQLGMLDTMERATADPAVLSDLFRLDHLTTRMRRHAEGLLILAGATPGRGWRDPVPVADVLQAAVAEVEDYVRVDVMIDSADAVAGTAVNDVIHLMAELIENATTFSPPNTRVTVTGSVVGRGFAVEIEDRGLGLAPDAMAAINERLASPPEFDLADSDQLGLFVAGRLAARHGIRVALRASHYGGITAIVVLPWEIIVPEHEGSTWFGPGGIGQLPSAAANGLTNKAGLAGNGEQRPAFGMTGRHRLLPSAVSPEGGGARGTELAGGPAPSLAGPAFPALPSAAPGQPGPSAPGPAKAPPGSQAAAARTIGSAELSWFGGPTRAAEPSESGAPAGPTRPAEPGESGAPAAPVESADVLEPAGITGPGADWTPREPEAPTSPGLRSNDGASGEGDASTGAGGQRASSANGAAHGTYLGLPRRVRMANLAPQLRGQLGAAQPSSDPLGSLEAGGPPARSPEQTGSRLSELQHGWLRGRLDDLEGPDADPATPPVGGQPGDASGEEAGPNDRGGES
jgi:signal transduction histidine kinase